MQLTPFDSKIADMLPLIESAGRTFLQGDFPYQTYYVPHILPLTFWPGLWMPFLPAIYFNFDLRWVGLIAWVIISIILILYSIRVSKQKSSAIILITSSINILLLQISTELLAFQAYGHTFVLWLLLLIMGIAIIEKRWLVSAILLGLVISSNFFSDSVCAMVSPIRMEESHFQRIHLWYFLFDSFTSIFFSRT
jgi:hypothetical protein